MGLEEDGYGYPRDMMAVIMGNMEGTECTQDTKDGDLKYFLLHFYNVNAFMNSWVFMFIFACPYFTSNRSRLNNKVTRLKIG